MNARARLSAALAAGILLLSGCASAAPAATPSATHAPAEAITVHDAWVKAAAEGMTAAFGVIENSSAADLTITGAQTTAAADVELHETTTDGAGQSLMREKDDGFVVPAGGELLLEPGGNHLMFLGLTAPLAAGDEVALTLTLSDGTTLSVTAPVKDFSGANENYDSDHADH